MVEKKTTGAVVIPLLIQCLRDNGISISEIESRTGISKNIMEEPDMRIYVDQHKKLWEIACEATGDPALPIHLREIYGNARMHFVNILATNSENGLAAIKNYKRYSKIVSEVIDLDVQKDNDAYKIIYNLAHPYHDNRYMVEHAFFMIFKYIVNLVNPHYAPIEVTFCHDCPDKIEVYEDFFQAPVKFQQSANTIVSRKEDLEKQISSNNPHLQQILKKQADRELAEFQPEISTSEKVRKMIIRKLASGNLDIESVAESLNMSRTTLFRKLKAESSSYNELLTDIRKEYAQEYIKNGMSIAQISFLLGYSTASNFLTAFKRWFGQNPGSFRQSTFV